jgi:hypothetical protein
VSDTIAEIRRVAQQAASVLPHTFEIITALDGEQIPPEALSEDHTIGLYGSIIPRKMRESADGFREVEAADFMPQLAYGPTATGTQAQWFLEYPALRNVRFRAEKLQYLVEGWWAVTAEVKYAAASVLALLYLLRKLYGAVHICVNAQLPMPLWLRAAPLGQDSRGVQAVVQARGGDKVLFTNIHTECSMAYARQFADDARSYYQPAE